MLQIGDQFDKFQIQGHVAQGGMSDIYRAHDLRTHHDVALKIPNQMMIGDPAQFERFQREVEILTTLQHPSIQHGLGSGTYNRTPFLVTEYIHGVSMRTLIQEEAPIPLEKALSLICKIADGIAYCHDHDVIHRDLKPENILVTTKGQPIIVDFGLALTKNSHRVTYANLSNTAGTPEYMSPEQVEGKRGDQRSDLYAIGIMLYELIMGKPPFTGDNPMAVMAQHLQQPVPRLDKDKPGTPLALAAIVARCLQRNPDDRYADLRALIQDIEHQEAVDVSILEKVTGHETAAPFWKSQTFIAIMIGFAILGGIIAFALLLQILRG